MSVLKDWRGQPIEVGATVLYSVKESTRVETVEATVVAVLDSGRLALDVVRRKVYNWNWRKTRVQVRPESVTVVWPASEPRGWW